MCRSKSSPRSARAAQLASLYARTLLFRRRGGFVIEAAKCTECVGHFDEPQCAAACPVDNTCVVDGALPRYQAPV